MGRDPVTANRSIRGGRKRDTVPVERRCTPATVVVSFYAISARAPSAIECDPVGQNFNTKLQLQA